MKRTILFLSIVVLLLSSPLRGRGGSSNRWDEYVMAAKEDITGDRKPENIQLIPIEKESRRFKLRVNNKEITDELSSGPADGFYIANVNRADKYKEIVVHTPGPSDDDEHMLFWFDGRQIRKMGTLSRWPKYLGNGVVLVKDWVSSFWEKTEKYVTTGAN